MSQQSKMARTMGLNLRVTGHCSQGGRKYMEDFYEVFYQLPSAEQDLEFAYFGVFDGHGGREAADFARKHLMKHIVQQKNFWSDDDDLVLKAIKDGFIATHLAMWKEVAKWPKTVSGLPSTSGTTASIAFIRQGKMYIGHVGDSKIVLGYQDPNSDKWLSQSLTKDHKPETPKEKERIYSVGGLVMNKAGVERVVWNRPRLGHTGPVRRSTHFDQIPFLAVARSLGDLWSYNYLKGEFIVSPEPDVHVITLDPKRDRCVILASDGLWNMSSPYDAVRTVHKVDQENTRLILESEDAVASSKALCSPSEVLVTRALKRWCNLQMRADNTSVLTVIIDPPGPPRQEVLLRQKMMLKLRPREEAESDVSENKKVENADPGWSKDDKSPGQREKKGPWSPSSQAAAKSHPTKPSTNGLRMSATTSDHCQGGCYSQKVPSSPCCESPAQTKPTVQQQRVRTPTPRMSPSPVMAELKENESLNSSNSDCISVCEHEAGHLTVQDQVAVIGSTEVADSEEVTLPTPSKTTRTVAQSEVDVAAEDSSRDSGDSNALVAASRTLQDVEPGSSKVVKQQHTAPTQKRKVLEEEKNVETAPPKKPCLPAWSDHHAVSSCRLVASQDLRLAHPTRASLRARKTKA